MQALKVIIVDDEIMARAVLRGILTENFPHVQICQECKDVPEAVKAIHTHKPDVVFLDIEMPYYTGFDLIDFFEPNQINFKIVFVTAYSQYSLQAFEFSAIDYLLKPIRIEHVERALKKIDKTSYQSANNTQVYKILQENLQNNADKKIVIQTVEAMHVIKTNDIVAIEADGGYSHFYVEGQGKIMASKGLSFFDFLEKDARFFRSHRRYIVNIEKIIRIDKKNASIILKEGIEVALAQEKKNDLIERLENRN